MFVSGVKIMDVLIDDALHFLMKIWNYDDPRAKCYAIVWINHSIGYRHFCSRSNDLFNKVRVWLINNLSDLANKKYHIYYQVLPLARKPEKGRGRSIDVLIGKWVWIDFDYKREILKFEVPDEFVEAVDKGYSFILETDHSLRGVYWDKRRRKWIYVERPPLKQLLEHIEDVLGIRPTIVVDSGNGYHVYFELKELLEAKYIKRLEDKIVDKLNGDPQTKDLARILRLPGTINPRNNRLVRLIYESNEALDPSNYIVDLL